MAQFEKETSCQNYEWHRERALREKKKRGQCAPSRMEYNLKAIQKKHGEKAAYELYKELKSK